MENTLLEVPPTAAKSRARLVFHEGDDVSPPREYSNRETWMAAQWLAELARAGVRNRGAVAELPEADADAVRRWFYHRWSETRDENASSAIKMKLAEIGPLYRVKWEEVAANYRRCPWADVIQETFAAAREAGLPLDRSAETVRKRRDAFAWFVERNIVSCRELSAEEWQRAGDAIRAGKLSW
jgi:hypothetical protein